MNTPVLPEIAGPALGRAYLFDDVFQAVPPRGHKQARSGTGLDLPDGRLRPRVALSSDDYGLAFEGGVVEFLHGDEEGVHVDVEDGARESGLVGGSHSP